MKIAIDLRPLQSEQNSRGISKYIANIVPQLIKLAGHHDFVCYHYGDAPPDLEYGGRVEFISLGQQNNPGHFGRMFSKLFPFPKRTISTKGSDVFYQPSIAFGLSEEVPTAAVLYDLIPIIYQEKYFSPRQRPRALSLVWRARANQVASRFRRMNRRFANVDHVVSISQASIEDLHRYFPEAKNVPYTVTPIAAQPLPAPRSGRICPRPYAVYVGGTDSRKNLVKLIDMYVQAQQDGANLDLILIGHDFTETTFKDTHVLLDHISKTEYRDRIKIIGQVDDLQLSTYYAQATCLLLASLYEGFGMTVLEAMQSNCPVVCFNNSSIPEVAGKAAKMVQSEKEFINAIVELSKNPVLRKELILAGKEQASKFTWDRAARLTLQALEETAGR